MRSLTFVKSFVVVAILTFSSIASAAYYARPLQTTIQQPAGTWVLYHRPCVIGEAFFGPLWIFIPNAQAAPNQGQAPGTNLMNPAIYRIPGNR